MKPIWAAACCAILCVLLLASCASKETQAASTKGGRPDGVPVLVSKVSTRDVPVEVQVIGNVEAYSTISVRAQVTGELTDVSFKEGDYVKKGDLLFTIDDRPLKAMVNQIEANLSKDQAALSQAHANLARDKANSDYVKGQAERYARLFKEGVVSRDQSEQLRTSADVTEQALKADLAAIKSAEAAVSATKAALDNAKVQQGYTTIRSPIEGRTGNLNVKRGNLVTANNMDLMTINQVEPIYVTFSVPENQLASIKRYMGQGKLRVSAAPQDNPEAAESGILTFVDNAVDPTTGTIKLKGTFENKGHKLWPGQFVRVQLRLTVQSNAVIVPNQAVQNGQDGNFVFVVKPDRTVESRPVVLGARSDQDMVIEQGLEPGETVVTEGQLRLKPGDKAIIQDGRGRPGAGRKKTT